MAPFRRSRPGYDPGGDPGVPGLDEYALRHGWRPLSQIPSDLDSYRAGDDMRQRVEALREIAAAMPASAVVRAGRPMRTLPDGTVLDDSDPERVAAALAAMPAQERDLLQARIAADIAQRRASNTAQPRANRGRE